MAPLGLCQPLTSSHPALAGSSLFTLYHSCKLYSLLFNCSSSLGSSHLPSLLTLQVPRALQNPEPNPCLPSGPGVRNFKSQESSLTLSFGSLGDGEEPMFQRLQAPYCLALWVPLFHHDLTLAL